MVSYMCAFCGDMRTWAKCETCDDRKVSQPQTSQSKAGTQRSRQVKIDGLVVDIHRRTNAEDEVLVSYLQSLDNVRTEDLDGYTHRWLVRAFGISGKE